jgi:hypothetical protein
LEVQPEICGLQLFPPLWNFCKHDLSGSSNCRTVTSGLKTPLASLLNSRRWSLSLLRDDASECSNEYECWWYSCSSSSGIAIRKLQPQSCEMSLSEELAERGLYAWFQSLASGISE